MILLVKWLVLIYLNINRRKKKLMRCNISAAKTGGATGSGPAWGGIADGELYEVGICWKGDWYGGVEKVGDVGKQSVFQQYDTGDTVWADK